MSPWLRGYVAGWLAGGTVTFLTLGFLAAFVLS